MLMKPHFPMTTNKFSIFHSIDQQTLLAHEIVIKLSDIKEVEL